MVVIEISDNDAAELRFLRPALNKAKEDYGTKADEVRRAAGCNPNDGKYSEDFKHLVAERLTSD